MEKVLKTFWRRKRQKAKKAREIYQNFTEEDKEKKDQYHCKHNKNLSEEQKQKLVEYIKNYYLAHKDFFTIKIFFEFFLVVLGYSIFHYSFAVSS